MQKLEAKSPWMWKWITPGAYVVRFGKKVLGGELTVEESNLTDGDVLELIPDPEGGFAW